MTEADAPPTEMFAGKYRLIRMLGKGAMGEVWLAEEEGPRSFRRRVAVKRLLSTTTDIGDIATSSFVAEAQVIAKLDHPNIVRLIELGNVDSELYLVLDYIDGAALDRLVKKKHGGGPLSPKTVAYIGREIALALESVHSLCDDSGTNYGVVHRDVSPSNILISRDGRVRLSDFGVARISAFHGEKTETGVFKGKLPYMPPEQARGQKFDGRADIFALGVTLFEALMGTRLRKAETQTQLIVLIATERAPRVHDLLPNIPEALATAIDATLEIDPEHRTEDGGRLAADLDAALRAFGPNAVKEAREELRARVEHVAGPPTTSSTLTGLKGHEIRTGSGVIKPVPWSVPLSRAEGPSPTDLDEDGPTEAGPGPAGSDSGSAPTAGLSPQTLRAAGGSPASEGRMAAQESSARKRVTALLAVVAVVVGAATVAVLMKKNPLESQPEGVAAGPASGASVAGAATGAPSGDATAASTGEVTVATTATATASAGSKDRSAPPEKGTATGPAAPAGNRGKPRPDGSAATSATAVDPGQPGTLQVIVLPWGDVTVDGKSVGTTPIPPISLPPGPHSVTVRNSELGATRSTSVVVKPGAPSAVKFDLRKTE